MIDTDADVANRYTYEPFGNIFAAETTETVENAFTFTGQWYDEEIGQYYLRARMYDPQLYRFTARDPCQGDFKEPLTLHAYLYCLNNPINHVDPEGESFTLAGLLIGVTISDALKGTHHVYVGYTASVVFGTIGAMIDKYWFGPMVAKYGKKAVEMVEYYIEAWFEAFTSTQGEDNRGG